MRCKLPAFSKGKNKRSLDHLSKDAALPPELLLLRCCREPDVDEDGPAAAVLCSTFGAR